MARFQGATWIPSPNFGYPRDTHGQLAFNISRAGKSGEFWHSQQGRQAVAISMFQNPATEVSAHFLIPKIGKPVQMVDSSDPAWHTGNYLANLHYHGFEFEGGPPGNLSEPLTASQRRWGVDITHWLRQVHGTPTRYVRKDTLWEHNEVRATACPSGRIPWAKVIAALEEDDMTDAEVNTLIDKRLKTLLGGHIPATGEMRFRAESRDGVALAAVTTLKRWLGVVDEHRKDSSKHGGTGGVTEAKARAIAIAEDKKLKVTK